MNRTINTLGFTYIELVMTLGILGVVSSMSILSFQRVYHEARFESELRETVQVVRDVGQRAAAVQNGMAWGVRCAGNRMEWFTHAPSQPETVKGTFTFSPRASCNGIGSAIKFKKLSGAPEALPAQFTIQEIGAGAYTIDVNAVGTVTVSGV